MNQNASKIETHRTTIKADFKPMNDALVEHRSAQGKETHAIHFSNEANLFYMVMFGCSLQKYKAEKKIDKNKTPRDYLSYFELAALADLQRYNIMLLKMGKDYRQRKETLKEFYLVAHQPQAMAS